MECQHENLVWVTETDSKGRLNVTVCSDCNEVVAAMDVTNG